MPQPGPHAMLAETTHDEAARLGFGRVLLPEAAVRELEHLEQ